MLIRLTTSNEVRHNYVIYWQTEVRLKRVLIRSDTRSTMPCINYNTSLDALHTAGVENVAFLNDR